MSKIKLINGSCIDQEVDAVVNAANDGLWAGGGICGAIFNKAGMNELTNACKKYKTPLRDGDAVITPAFNITNAKVIIHAVGPNFSVTPKAFNELFKAYYNSLIVLKDYGYHSISFPLISSGIFGGSLENPVAESTKQCCGAYLKFIKDFPAYDIDVRLCAFSSNEMAKAQKVFDAIIDSEEKMYRKVDYSYEDNLTGEYSSGYFDLEDCRIHISRKRGTTEETLSGRLRWLLNGVGWCLLRMKDIKDITDDARYNYTLTYYNNELEVALTRRGAFDLTDENPDESMLPVIRLYEFMNQIMEERRL